MTDAAPVVPDGFEVAARAALAEVTSPDSVGELVGAESSAEEVTDVSFASRLPGYIDWRWTVSMVRLEDAEPSVLEVELLPGDGAILAPPWVPWAERLAEYRRTHPEDAEAVDEEDPDEDDDLDVDEDVLDDEVDDVLDGVDFEVTGDADDDEDVLDDDLDEGAVDPGDDADGDSAAFDDEVEDDEELSEPGPAEERRSEV